MANNPLNTDLMALHTAIRDQIAEQFPDFQTVEFYRDDENENIPTPACLLEMDDFEPADNDPGTGQLGVALRFSARLMFSRENGPGAPLQIRVASAALAAFLNKRRFIGGVAPAHILGGSADIFRPNVSGRWSIWKIEWNHPLAFFGENVWKNEGWVAQQVFCAHALEEETMKEIWKNA